MNGSSSQRTEVELKYTVSDASRLRSWLDRLEIEDLTGTTSSETAVSDRYFDTAQRSLESAGYGARLRNQNGRWLVTLKSSATIPDSWHERTGNASTTRPELHRRAELEGPAGPELDLATWPETEVRRAVEQFVRGASLVERFEIRQRRRERRFTGVEGTALISLDDVAVHRGAVQLGAFAQLEVELEAGYDQLLDRIAEAIEATGLVTPEPRSKEQIASALVAAADTAATPADTRRRQLPLVRHPGISPDQPLGEAGRHVLRMHLARMLDHEASTRLDEDPEALHKMRVATRRMRAAWRVFRRRVPASPPTPIHPRAACRRSGARRRA